MAFTLDDSGSGASPGEAADSGIGGDDFGAVNFGSGDGAGDVDSNGDGFDPDVHIARNKLNADGSYRKKRRRKGGGSGPTARANRPKADHSASLDALSGMLMIVHAGLASMTKFDDFALTKPESDTLARAVSNVLAEFDIQPDPKVQAIVGLVVTGATIYGPRIYLYNEALKEKNKKPASVHVLHPGGAPTEHYPSEFPQQ